MAAFYGDTETQSNPTKPRFLPVVESEIEPDKEETPIFSKRKMSLLIPDAYKGDHFSHLVVCKNWVVCIVTTPSNTRTTLLRFFLPRAMPPGEIILSNYLVGYKISKLFLDPTGHHILVSLVPRSPGLLADFLYIHDKKVRRIEKFKDHEITAVAFNKYFGNESTTGPILLGTSRGLIFETELTLEADKPLYRKQVFDVGPNRTKYPITDLEIVSMATAHKYFVVATTPDCLYTFQETLRPEERSLQALFAAYVNGSKIPITRKATSDLNYSSLRFYAPPNGKFPIHWAWLHGAGMHVGEVCNKVDKDEFLLGEELISLGTRQREVLSYDQRRQSVPKTFVLTEYHALLLYTDHVTGICLLNQEVVYEEYFPEQIGKFLSIVRDSFTGTVYFYTEKALFNFRITEEQRNMWRIYLNKGEYDLAELHAGENTDQVDTVRSKRADAAFEAGECELAALLYAGTNRSFEEICLKFMELENKRPVIIYATKRIDMVENSPEHMTVLVIWLTDLYLTQINYPGRSAEESAVWQHDFDLFMQDARVVSCARANRSAIQNLIAQYADKHNLSQFAIANEDYEEVVRQLLDAERYIDALATLGKQNDVELYYTYCPILMEYLPHETVEVLIKKGRRLDIKKLVPTLITTESKKHIAEIMKYMEYAIYTLGETEESIHNYLLRLYAEHNPEKLIKYLEEQGHDDGLVCYEINYALSICLQFKQKKASVHVYCLLGMWTCAMDLAFEFDLQLAKEIASKPPDKEKQRKLWLKIAKHEIEGTNDVRKALNLLKECHLLRIEDLLPFFSDFEKIDDFKQPICDALKEYNNKIQEVQREMEECTKQSELVCTDLQNIRPHSIRIKAHESCMLCESYLLIKPFFVFACGHKFHNDCLEKQVIPMLSSDNSRKLTMLKQELETMLTQSIAAANTTQKQQKKRETIKREIEEILASDCLLCGLMIETVDQPFVEDWDQVNVDWE